MEIQITQDQNSNLSSRKIRFGVIGCSRIAKKSVLPAIIDSELAELGRIGTRSKEKALEFSKEFGCDSYGSYEEVLEDKTIDAVYISLPVNLHEEWTIKSAEAGKHVLCEKSSTTSLESAKRMVQACRENNVRLLEGFMFRYHPQHAKVKEFINNGSLGNLLTFEGRFGFPFPDKDNIRMIKEMKTGVLNDVLCYPIYASRMLFGEEPLTVVCNLERNQEGVDVKANILMNYPNGKVAFASSAFGAHYQSTYSLWGAKSTLGMKRAYAVPKDMKTSIYTTKDDKFAELVISPDDHFRIMIDDFCKTLNSGTENNDFEVDLIAQARVLEAARLSDKEKRIVSLSSVC